MKYLTTYRLFESVDVSPSVVGETYPQEFIDNLEDRCYDISDKGYDVDIDLIIYKKSFYNSAFIKSIRSIVSCCISITNRGSNISYNDIYETKETIKEYVTGLGYEMETELTGEEGNGNDKYYDKINLIIYKI